MSSISTLKEMRFSETVQATIWFLSLLSASFYFREIVRGVDTRGEYVAAVSFGFVTLAQQIAVYFDILRYENNIEDVLKEYGAWINHWFEKTLRYLIFFSLLLGAGKITGAIYHWFPCMGELGSRGYICEVIKHEGTSHIDLFVIGACLVFLWLFLWNFSAFFFHRIQNIQIKKGKRLVYSTRIVLFAISALMALIYWLTVYYWGKSVGNVSLLLIVTYILTAGFGTLLNSRKVVDVISRRIRDD